MIPKAVIFDVDGTLADTERFGHRVAFNRAFEHLGLPDRWNEDLYGELLRSVPGGRKRIEHYFEMQGTLSSKRPSLSRELHELKNRFFIELINNGEIPLRPGVLRLLEDLRSNSVTIAVATTGSRLWVDHLLEAALGDLSGQIAATVCGGDVERLKPHPDLYQLALQRLGCEHRAVAAIEDSETGLRSAKAAGICCVIVRNLYTVNDDVAKADLVTDEFGTPAERAKVVFNPHGIPYKGMIDTETLRQLLEACRTKHQQST